MNIILLSGGSGKRLWPLSNDIRSKQFIKIFKNEDDSYESMVQRMYSRIRKLDSEANVTIATSKQQISALHNQLGEDVDISLEPCRRDTFPAIALAAAYMVYEKNIAPTEPVVICPVDPFVENDYFESLQYLFAKVEGSGANLLLMGIEPTYPSEKYGYIMPRANSECDGIAGDGVESVAAGGNGDARLILTVDSFKEKPTKEVASEYIKQGALWNAGVFACRLEYILAKAHELIEFTDYRDLFAQYASLPKISFDYAVVEKEKNIKMVKFSGIWKDLGTWNTLTEAMDENVIGKGTLGDECENVHIINETNLPILAMGMHDVVISASPEGILVTDKDQSSYIKPYVDAIDQQIMFAEKSWGSFSVIDVEKASLTIKVTLNPGHSMNYHSHNNRDEVWVVVAGEGTTIVDGMAQKVKAGDVISMCAGCRHTIIAKTELKLIEVQLGNDISVNDKQKYELEYSDNI